MSQPSADEEDREEWGGTALGAPARRASVDQGLGPLDRRRSIAELVGSISK
jgi:hypothetical protein